ncbi:MAG: NfeD family protein [Candidatus Hydrogenedentes bacterium]|nr:NfeD family protein [Candidatus Hydrogenedentota bacterium]
MRSVRIALVFAMLAGLTVIGGEESPSYIMTVRLDGMVDDGMTVLVSRAVREVTEADALVLIIDTPGGLVDAAVTIADLIVKAPCKTVAYIDGMGAISAGALIAYACDEIVMSPSTNMGAAQPVSFGAEGMTPLGEKEMSYVRAKFAALAEMKGRNPDIAMAMVDQDIELRAYTQPDGTLEIRGTSKPQKSIGTEIVKTLSTSPEDTVKKIVEVIIGQELPGVAPKRPGEAGEPVQTDNPETATDESTVSAASTVEDGVVIEAAGKLLTLTPLEAKKYGVISHIAEDLEQLQWQLGYTNAAVIAIEPTWSEGLYRWLISPQMTLLLLVFGVGGLYIEIKTPGFGLPGFIGIAALAIFFGSRMVIGLSDWIDLALVVIGIALILVEIFVLPGFGFIGVMGIMFVLSGVVLSFTYSDFTIPQYSWEWARLETAGFVLTMTMLCSIVLVIATWKLLPQTPLYGKLVLMDQQLAAEGFTVQGRNEVQSAIGRQGVATSLLRPAGRGRFGDKTLQVVSVSEFIEEGTPIVIVQVEGNRYVVDRAKTG